MSIDLAACLCGRRVNPTNGLCSLGCFLLTDFSLGTMTGPPGDGRGVVTGREFRVGVDSEAIGGGERAA